MRNGNSGPTWNSYFDNVCAFYAQFFRNTAPGLVPASINLPLIIPSLFWWPSLYCTCIRSMFELSLWRLNRVVRVYLVLNNEFCTDRSMFGLTFSRVDQYPNQRLVYPFLYCPVIVVSSVLQWFTPPPTLWSRFLEEGEIRLRWDSFELRSAFVGGEKRPTKSNKPQKGENEV